MALLSPCRPVMLQPGWKVGSQIQAGKHSAVTSSSVDQFER
jgi:hypothetical protein